MVRSALSWDKALATLCADETPLLGEAQLGWQGLACEGGWLSSEQPCVGETADPHSRLSPLLE